jgi:2-polyprenyl-3-methyl-5-hydroxy-6-metoxy-1,4-benzoquinol methylase
MVHSISSTAGKTLNLMKTLNLDYVAVCRRDFPTEFALAEQATEQVIAATRRSDFSSLERHSPGLKGFDWENYLRLSSIRMVRALRHLTQTLVPGSRVLDFGSYFGNFSLMTAYAGFQVTALDTYKNYGSCFSELLNVLQARRIEIIENLTDCFPDGNEFKFDAVLLMGVIEHIPHTPRFLLRDIYSAMRPGGLLVLDTPNLAYLYTRQRLARGESIFTSIQSQFWTELPFEGHHREYTSTEVEWMLSESGFQVNSFEAFNYSLYGLSQISGNDLDNFQIMEADPLARELLMFSALRSAD